MSDLFFDSSNFSFPKKPRLFFYYTATYFLTMLRAIFGSRSVLCFWPCGVFFSTMPRHIFRLNLFFFEHATTYFLLIQLIFRTCYEFVLTMPRINFVHATCFVSTTPRSIFRPCQDLSSNMPRPITHNNAMFRFSTMHTTIFWSRRVFIFNHAATNFLASHDLPFDPASTYFSILPPLFSFFDHIAAFFNHAMAYFSIRQRNDYTGTCFWPSHNLFLDHIAF